MTMRPRHVLPIAVLVAGLAALAGTSLASTSHQGWPTINGMLVMNKLDSNRPIDGRIGADPFGGKDPLYRCDGVHKSQRCLSAVARCEDHSGRSNGCRKFVNKPHRRHNELLGGHGSDTIHAGPNGDVIWGDYKPSGQPSSQRDRLFGGAGRDFIYASHGWNTIEAGGGNDYVKAHYGRGIIDCGSGRDTLYVSRRAQKNYKIRHCERISHKSLGY